MGKRSKYLYEVRMDIDPAEEKKFNDWYNLEHIPALLKVPGVSGAYRYATVEGSPKYSAVYEIETPDIILSEAWKTAAEQTNSRKAGLTHRNVSRSIRERIYPKD
jgi:hypothetical protein